MVLFPGLPLLIHQAVEGHFPNYYASQFQVFTTRFESEGILLPQTLPGRVPV